MIGGTPFICLLMNDRAKMCFTPHFCAIFTRKLFFGDCVCMCAHEQKIDKQYCFNKCLFTIWNIIIILWGDIYQLELRPKSRTLLLTSRPDGGSKLWIQRWCQTSSQHHWRQFQKPGQRQSRSPRWPTKVIPSLLVPCLILVLFSLFNSFFFKLSFLKGFCFFKIFSFSVFLACVVSCCSFLHWFKRIRKGFLWWGSSAYLYFFLKGCLDIRRMYEVRGFTGILLFIGWSLVLQSEHEGYRKRKLLMLLNTWDCLLVTFLSQNNNCSSFFTQINLMPL